MKESNLKTYKIRILDYNFNQLTRWISNSI